MSDAEFSLLRRRLQESNSPQDRVKLRRAALRLGHDVPIERGDTYLLGPYTKVVAWKTPVDWCAEHAVDGWTEVVVTCIDPLGGGTNQYNHLMSVRCTKCPEVLEGGIEPSGIPTIHRQLKLVRLNGEP